MKVIIELEGLSFHAFHGYYEEERRSGNRFLVDVKIEANQNDDVDFDDLNNTINYEEVYALVKKNMEQPALLLEHVARNILNGIYGQWSFIVSAEVSISKLSAPIGGPCRHAKVTLKK